MRVILFSAFLCFSVKLLATDVSVQKEPDFTINSSLLECGTTQYFAHIVDKNSLFKKAGSLAALAQDSWTLDKGHFFSVSKVAYILPVNASLLVKEKIYNDDKFLRAMYPKIVNIIYPDPHNGLEQIHEYKSLKILKSTHHFEMKNRVAVYDPSQPTINVEVLSLANRLGDSSVNLPLAAVVVQDASDSTESMIERGIIVTKYYSYKGATLAIVYRAVLLKPSGWLIKQGLVHGEALLIKDDQEHYIEGIKAASHYLRGR